MKIKSLTMLKSLRPVHLGRLRNHVPLPPPPSCCVPQAGERLLMQFSGCNGILDGQSPGVAAVLSLLSLVVENKRAGDEGGVVVVTGVVDLVGKVHGVGGLAGKLQVRGGTAISQLYVAMAGGIRLASCALGCDLPCSDASLRGWS